MLLNFYYVFFQLFSIISANFSHNIQINIQCILSKTSFILCKQKRSIKRKFEQKTELMHESNYYHFILANYYHFILANIYRFSLNSIFS